MTTSEQIGEVAMIFLAFRDQLKIYHWQTTKYSAHKTSDNLVNIVTDQMDRFLETLQGSRNVRIKIPPKHKFILFEDQTDSSILVLLSTFKTWLSVTLEKMLGPFDKDLSNIRDEILGSVNKSLYLFTFN